jgi:hypothetical protein
MPRYALAINGVFSRVQESATKPPDIAHKNVKWLSCPVIAAPSFDPDTEKLTGPTYTVNANDVTEAWAVVTMTAPEQANRKTTKFDNINGNGIKKVLHQIYNKALQGNSEATMNFGAFQVWMKDQL